MFFNFLFQNCHMWGRKESCELSRSNILRTLSWIESWLLFVSFRAGQCLVLTSHERLEVWPMLPVFLHLDFLFSIELIIYSPPPWKVSAGPDDKPFLWTGRNISTGRCGGRLRCSSRSVLTSANKLWHHLGLKFGAEPEGANSVSWDESRSLRAGKCQTICSSNFIISC